MKKLPLLIVTILFLNIFVACQGDKQYDSLLQQADSIMNIDDDSAKVAIKLLDKAKPQLDNFSKAQRMRYELLYHKAMNKADIPFTSDSIMKNVINYYNNHGSANERMLAYYMLGCVYRDLHGSPDISRGNFFDSTEKFIPLHHEQSRTIIIGTVDTAIRDTFKF